MCCELCVSTVWPALCELTVSSDRGFPPHCLQLAAAKEGLDGKLTDCKQYQQMKGMMQAKSAEVVALRKRLAAYEPQDVPSADAQ